MISPYKCLLFLLLVTCYSGCDSVQTPTPIADRIHEMIDTTNGEYAVAFLNPENGEQILINAHEPFHAASTMKTPVMIEAFKYLKAHNHRLLDSIEVYNLFYSIVDSSQYTLTADQDGDPDLYELVGTKLTWRDLIYRMITRSSNLATNILIDQLEAQNVTKTMRDLGASDIQVLRGVEDIKAYEAGLSNTTTAYDLMMIFEKLAHFAVVDSASSQEMIDILLDQEFNSLIPAFLPENVKVAHKTGSITGVHHDSGIVFLPDGGSYILVLLSKEVKDMARADEVLSSISRILYDHVVGIQPDVVKNSERE